MNAYWTTKFESFDNVVTRIEAGDSTAWSCAFQLATDSLRVLAEDIHSAPPWREPAQEAFAKAKVGAEKRDLELFTDGYQSARALID
jgi:hypothetical protein